MPYTKHRLHHNKDVKVLINSASPDSEVSQALKLEYHNGVLTIGLWANMMIWLRNLKNSSLPYCKEAANVYQANIDCYNSKTLNVST
tara:strand:+ start:6246 stop:6506 length:261 start_codon:yes stop_codon:yes gene_type:complete